MLAAGVTESLCQMRFACACRTNKGQVPVRVDGIQRGQNLQTFHIFPLEQGEIKVLKWEKSKFSNFEVKVRLMEKHDF